MAASLAGAGLGFPAFSRRLPRLVLPSSHPPTHPRPTPLPAAVCASLKDGAEKGGVEKGKVIGPVRLPTKVLRITTRKTPCGEGTKTWDRFELRIHKRIIDLKTTNEVVKQVTNITIDPSVQIEVKVRTRRAAAIGGAALGRGAERRGRSFVVRHPQASPQVASWDRGQVAARPIQRPFSGTTSHGLRGCFRGCCFALCALPSQ